MKREEDPGYISEKTVETLSHKLIQFTNHLTIMEEFYVLLGQSVNTY